MMKSFFYVLILGISTLTSVGSHANFEKIGLIQFVGEMGKTEKNTAQLLKFVESLKQSGADLVVLPEGAIDGYGRFNEQNSYVEYWCKPNDRQPVCRDVTEVAEVVPGGERVKYWSEVALRLNLMLVIHVAEKDNNDFFSTAVVIGPQGFIGKYRKMNLHYTDAYATSGDTPFVFRSPAGNNFGLLICKDGHYTDYGYKDVYAKYRTLGVKNLLALGFGIDPEIYATFAKKYGVNSIGIADFQVTGGILGGLYRALVQPDKVGGAVFDDRAMTYSEEIQVLPAGFNRQYLKLPMQID